MREIWTDIPNYKKHYQISTFGRIKSIKFNKEKILKQIISGRYYFINLYKDKKKITFKVSTLIAITFLNHKPNRMKIVIDHIDNNPLNNKLDNLQLITHRENLSKDRWRKNTSSKYIGVGWIKSNKKWRAIIYINGKNKYLGYFKTELEASNAYQNELNSL